MESWQWAVLLKPAAAMIGAVAYFFLVIKGLRWLYAKLPRSRFVDFLFKERANRRPDYGPGFDSRRGPGTGSVLDLARLEDGGDRCATSQTARPR